MRKLNRRKKTDSESFYVRSCVCLYKYRMYDPASAFYACFKGVSGLIICHSLLNVPKVGGKLSNKFSFSKFHNVTTKKLKKNE